MIKSVNIPDSIFYKVACVARARGLSIEEAVIFLLSKVITPEIGSFVREGDNT